MGGETFIPGEWLHLSDNFKVDLVKYPFIKSPQTILAEKYAENSKDESLAQFAAGIKQAEEMYNTTSDPLTAQILTLTKA